MCSMHDTLALLMIRLEIAEQNPSGFHACYMLVQEFKSENESKETAFQAAITAVHQASSEQELDEHVGSALSSLDLSVPLLPDEFVCSVCRVLCCALRLCFPRLVCAQVDVAHCAVCFTRFLSML